MENNRCITDRAHKNKIIIGKTPMMHVRKYRSFQRPRGEQDLTY